MTWHETLEGLKQELADVRAERERRLEAEDTELQSEREGLSQTNRTLGISELLAEMNATLLDGKGSIEVIVGWEPHVEELELDPGIGMNGDEPEGIEGEADVITTILSWDERGDLEIAVDLGLSADGIYLQINEIEIRPEREALEQGLVEAFRDELEL
ncbi:MAG: hypothetical protein O2913_08985 [Chloroflexi bacterium]|nr:hypothetical protein [Chloroflexota bacterium]